VRHRSPSGARPVPGNVASPRAASARGGHRLPAPPASSLRVRMTVAACAGGALVAAGQTMLTALGGPVVETDPYEKLAANAMLPVADEVATAPRAANAAATPTTTAQAIGADQLAGAPQALPVLDQRSEVDVASLTKAVDIGTKIAATAKKMQSALAAGAPQAVLDEGRAYVLPTTGRFTSGFGARWGVTHYGIDLAAPIGTPIFAFTDGVVEESGPASGFGMWVVLKHPDGTHTVYGHINRSFVTVGQTVKAGQQIAEVGNRGQSTGPHLHFEIWDAAKNKLNPLPILTAMGLRVTGPGDGAGD
jgi:murein DD-endopeptidase MepM/ murein hydrolase activator NlpD